MDKKKMLYILIAVLAVILVACLILIPVLKGGNADADQPGTTQGDGNGEIDDNGDEGNSDNTGSGDTGNNNTGNTDTGNTGNSDSGNSGNNNTGNGNSNTGNGNTVIVDPDTDISIEIGVEDNDFGDSNTTGGNSGSTDSTEGTEGADNVIRFPDLVDND